jgi:DNA-binding transcriptional MocR family regulator
MSVSNSLSITLGFHAFRRSQLLFFQTNFIKMNISHSPPPKPINLLRGWPNPSLLPTKAIATAAQSALSNPSISTPGLLYGPDPGYQPLREEISKWLSKFYGSPADANRVCITGGASQNLACVLQVFTDPVYTRVWMVAPCYFLACRMFDDSGLRTGAIPEGEEGIDLEYLKRKLVAAEAEDGERIVSIPFFLLYYFWFDSISSIFLFVT